MPLAVLDLRRSHEIEIRIVGNDANDELWDESPFCDF